MLFIYTIKGVHPDHTTTRLGTVLWGWVCVRKGGGVGLLGVVVWFYEVGVFAYCFYYCLYLYFVFYFSSVL